MTPARTALLLLALRGAAAENEVRTPGPNALAEVLARLTDDDADVRLRARDLATRIVLDFYEAQAPAGMCLVAGKLTLSARGVRCEGGFYLGTSEITLAEFRPFAREQGLTDRWADGDGSLPATNVSLEEARAFARARGARLPTLEELAYAATGGGRFRYPWGERFEPCRVNSREAGRGCAEPAASRREGVSVHGIADLLGNVAEWTETPAAGRSFVAAGGSYRNPARAVRFTDPTYRLEPQARLPDVGFRLAKSLPPLPSEGP
jgi:hypothetical protein